MINLSSFCVPRIKDLIEINTWRSFRPQSLSYLEKKLCFCKKTIFEINQYCVINVNDIHLSYTFDYLPCDHI